MPCVLCNEIDGVDICRACYNSVAVVLENLISTIKCCYYPNEGGLVDIATILSAAEGAKKALGDYNDSSTTEEDS
jgi:hypothetical protein